MDIQKKMAALAQLKRQALRLSPTKALDFIVSSPDAPAIVHSLAEQDFHCLVNEIGPEDSLELLALARESQWEYIMDIEAWRKDRVASASVVRWFDLLMQADSERFLKWITSAKRDFLELFLNRRIEAGIRDDNQDPSEFDDDYFTFDDLFYVRFTEEENRPVERDEEDEGIGQAEEEREYQRQVLYDFLQLFSSEDHLLFQEFLFYAAAVMPAEAEEESYRLRNVRLAEKGLLPFDEAIGIYQPCPDFHCLPKKEGIAPTIDPTLPVPLTPSAAVDENMFFSQALALIDSPETRQGLQAELATLCNRIAVADQVVIKERTSLRTVVRKACGYIGLGLTGLAGREEEERADPARAAAIMGEYFLADIFRIGYSRAVALKQKAEHWYRRSWFRRCGLPVSFWGDDQQAVLAGLLVKRPLYYDINLEGGRYREFENPSDIKQAAATLERVMIMDDLLAAAAFDPSPISFDILNYKNMLLTLWARECLGLPPTVDYIPLADFTHFYDDLLAAPPSAADDYSQNDRVVSDQRKQLFLDWLAMATGLSAYDIAGRAGEILEDMFTEIDETLGRVPPEALDPRYVDIFLVSG